MQQIDRFDLIGILAVNPILRQSIISIGLIGEYGF